MPPWRRWIVTEPASSVSGPLGGSPGTRVCGSEPAPYLGEQWRLIGERNEERLRGSED